MKHLASIVLLVLFVAFSASGQIMNVTSGNWSAGATWSGGNVPGPSDNVIVDTSTTVTIDIPNAVCNDLTAKGYLLFNQLSSGNGLTVYGDVLVDSTGRLRSGAATPTGIQTQFLTLHKDLTVRFGGSFDMRIGSGSSVSVGSLVFAGDTDTEIRMGRTAYVSSAEEFNSVTIRKNNGAKVIVVEGVVYQNNNSTNAMDTLMLESGIIETQGTSAWHHLGTSSAHVQGASPLSYVNGNHGRGLSNTSGATNINRIFEVGDANGYRRITLRCQAPTLVTGAYVAVQVISGNANTGSSAFTGGIDKVSASRYYKITYYDSTSATKSMPIDLFIPEYQAEDGVSAGNTDLRVAYSTDDRATWVGMPQATADTTFVTDNAIRPDSLPSGSWVTVTRSTVVYAALARATGTTTNSLEYTPTGVGEETVVPVAFSLGQNYPNPFNPSTSIRFGIDKPGFTTVRVYDMLGRLVTTLAEGMMAPGFHTVTWNADGASSGLYFYTLQSGEKMQTRKMLLMK